MPRTVTVYVPAEVPAGAVMVRVEVPEPEIGFVLKAVVKLDVVVAERVTCPEKPLSATTVMVIVAGLDVAVFSATVLGEDEIVKSATGVGVKLVVSGLPIPVTRSYPGPVWYEPAWPDVMSLKSDAYAGEL